MPLSRYLGILVCLRQAPSLAMACQRQDAIGDYSQLRSSGSSTCVSSVGVSRNESYEDMNSHQDRPRVHFNPDTPEVVPSKPLKSAFKSSGSGGRSSVLPPTKSGSSANLAESYFFPTVNDESEDVASSPPTNQGRSKLGTGLFEIGPAFSLEDVAEELPGPQESAHATQEIVSSQQNHHGSKESPHLLDHDATGDKSLRVNTRVSRPHSLLSMANSPPLSPAGTIVENPIDFNNIPLERLKRRRTKYGIEDDSDEDLEEGGKKTRVRKVGKRIRIAAKRLYRDLDLPELSSLFRDSANDGIKSGQTTPGGLLSARTQIDSPKDYSSIISSMLRLHGFGPEQGTELHMLYDKLPNETPYTSPTASGASTPTGRSKVPKWHQKSPSTSSLSILAQQSSVLAQPAGPGRGTRPPHKRSRSSGALNTLVTKIKALRPEDEVRHQNHIEAVIFRQRYLRKLCEALMQYGAPTHRLEEYMNAAAKTLAVQANFLYLPGCMICSYDDPTWHTTQVNIVRVKQGLDLGKMHEMHDVYKAVVHEKLSVTEAAMHLDEITRSPKRYPNWVLILFYGLASACVGPFAFQARLIDLPIAFLLGCFLGTMQLVIAPRSDLYANVFEIAAAIGTSFLARLFGSLHGGDLFCFSALAQSSIALILPGYTVLSAALELQSRNVVAGSIRMVYAIIFSLFLGFGITVGTSMYGAIHTKATSETTCRHPMPPYYPFLFVPPFTFCLIVINQGKWAQMPMMLLLSFMGYIVNHFSAVHFPGNTQIANSLGAFAIGIGGNLYSRFFHGFAAAALIPAIFVQVPSGLAASGSLISGVVSANQITNVTGPGNDTTVANGTILSGGTTTSPQIIGGIIVNSEVLVVGYIMIQIAIGITVGLFVSALVVYPFGKKRSGLFSF